jgi:Family of unknown function (DUF6599)
MRRTLLRSFLFIFLASQMRAELPKAFRGWEGKTTQTISLPQLASAAGDDAPVVREYGFLGAERREYAKGSSSITVTLWRMQDATASLGLYTYFDKPGMSDVKAGPDLAAGGPDRYLLQRGPYLLQVEGQGLSPEETAELARAVPPPTHGRENLVPTLPSFLPEKGRVPQSQKYILGPIVYSRLINRIPVSAIGFDLGAEAALAQYRIEGRDVQLLLVSYPTPQIAAKKLQDFQNLPALAQNDNGKTLFVERKSSLIAFIMDAPSLAATEKLLASITYGTDVTWNEYVPPRSENVGVMMISIFDLAGLLLLFFFVAGLAFGGVRVLAKRFIPIPIFDRPSQMEIIRLNLSGL